MKKEIYLLLHNIRSAYNVGSIFRTADAAGISKIYICGYTPTPDQEKVKKTSLGAEKTVPWEQCKQTWRLLEKLQRDNVQLVALELSKNAIDYRKYNPQFPLALLVGNEVRGLSTKILSYVKKTLIIPMRGKKESLNVAVATGIMIYKLIE